MDDIALGLLIIVGGIAAIVVLCAIKLVIDFLMDALLEQLERLIGVVASLMLAALKAPFVLLRRALSGRKQTEEGCVNERYRLLRKLYEQDGENIKVSFEELVAFIERGPQEQEMPHPPARIENLRQAGQ